MDSLPSPSTRRPACMLHQYLKVHLVMFAVMNTSMLTARVLGSSSSSSSSLSSSSFSCCSAKPTLRAQSPAASHTWGVAVTEGVH